MFKKVAGSSLVILGFLLSPLCWWNDLFFNLPIAYFLGRVCSWFIPELLIPSLIAGYWLSNLAGILLMQFGTVKILEQRTEDHSLKKDLLMGLFSSTVFTLVVLALIQLKVLDISSFLSIT